MKPLKRTALSMLLLPFFLSCSLDYEQARVAETISGQIPETVLFSFTHTIVSGGSVWVVLEAEKAETYTEKKEIVLEGVHFREYDEQGNLLTEAQADRAIFNTESEDATVSGGIVIYSPGEQAALRANQLSWTREGRRLIAEDGQTVRLLKDDGSFVEGRGFAADFRRKKLQFSSRVRGSYVWEEEEE
jgi:LPS export ABC transporter protein LptC